MGATTPQLATVRARMYEPLEPRKGIEAEVEYLRSELRARDGLRVRAGEAREDAGAADLLASDTVVVLGASSDDVGESSGAALALGGTHEVCAAGRLPRQLEVGLYGHAVAPRLLIAVGLDGRMEDLAGFVKAAVVLSIGSEAAAWADVALAGDGRELAPRLAPLGAG
jgi:electron transfer flavoprotein alpha subunit